MIATCTLETTGRNLWVSFPGSLISLRIRHSGTLPRDMKELDGHCLPLQEVQALLPSVTASQFKPTRHNPPELRADVSDWHISVLAPATTAAIGERESILGELEAWVRNWLGASA